MPGPSGARHLEGAGRQRGQRQQRARREVRHQRRQAHRSGQERIGERGAVHRRPGHRGRQLEGRSAPIRLWLYVNVRLLFNFVKSSLKYGLRWVVQEPNDPTLWSKVKYNSVTPFLMGLWRRGAFGPGAPDKVFSVKVDGENNPPANIQQGIFNVEVYFLSFASGRDGHHHRGATRRRRVGKRSLIARRAHHGGSWVHRSV